MGEPSDRIFDEMTPIVPLTERAARIAIDQLVLTAPGIQSVVLCNSMIYGSALGSPAESVQIPALVRQAKVSGVARYIGRGLNRWSNVHIADVAALYVLAIARAPAGSFMYVESGEEALGEIVRAIAAQLGLGPAQSIRPKRRSRSGAGTWRYSPSAPTVAYAAGPRSISVGCPHIAQSQGGSRAILFSANCTSARRNEHHSELLSKNKERD
jgi:nucleoside-diphosphate-sugar epimerase